MFDLGWSKVLILAVVAIVVVGPKELPTLLRAVGQFIAQLRRHAAEFRSQFDEAMKSTELDQIRRDVEAIKTDAKASLRGIEQSIEKDMGEAKASVDAVMDKAEADIAAVKAANGTHTGTPSESVAIAGSSPVPAADLPEPATFATPAMPPTPVMAEPAPIAAQVPAQIPAQIPVKTGTGS